MGLYLQYMGAYCIFFSSVVEGKNEEWECSNIVMKYEWTGIILTGLWSV